MKKYPIGFNTRINKESEIYKQMKACKGVMEMNTMATLQSSINTDMNKKVFGKISLGA